MNQRQVDRQMSQIEILIENEREREKKSDRVKTEEEVEIGFGRKYRTYRTHNYSVKGEQRRDQVEQIEKRREDRRRN